MKPRVLHLITVYNGRPFVPRAIKSAMNIDRSCAEVDVLILDDASPEPGWSEELQSICQTLGARYYRAPRNLGIPRNCSLGLRAAMHGNYDYVTINNSDVIFPRNLINVMLEACKHQRVGSVTAWSNNVSIYSLPNTDPDLFLSEQSTVDFISEKFFEKYGSDVIDVPAGISFCIMMPVEVVRQVGVMDPIFGRGYCEETDWSLRSLSFGYRICLAPGTFVYHQGRGSNLAAGLVSGAHTTVPENEWIIDRRYPRFREQCQEFETTGIMSKLKMEAVDYLIDKSAAVLGYSVVPAGYEPNATSDTRLRIEVHADEMLPQLAYNFAGFEQRWPLDGVNTLQAAIERFGRKNMLDNLFDLDLRNPYQANPYPRQAF